MDIQEDSVARVKKTLVRMTKRKKASVTGRELVQVLAPEIHAQLKDGHGLKAIWFTIIAELPNGEGMTFGTFKKYWQGSRQALGFAPAKSQARPTAPVAKGLDHKTRVVKARPPAPPCAQAAIATSP